VLPNQVGNSTVQSLPVFEEQVRMTNDPIADMLARLKNAAAIKHPQVLMPASKLRVAVARILKDEGYIEKMELTKDKPQPMLRVWLRYDENRKPVLSGVKRIPNRSAASMPAKLSAPWCARVWRCDHLYRPRVSRRARAKRMGLGGEILCYVW
jgi:small subunit ribosomal protein S8